MLRVSDSALERCLQVAICSLCNQREMDESVILRDIYTQISRNLCDIRTFDLESA